MEFNNMKFLALHPHNNNHPGNPGGVNYVGVV